MCKRLGPDPEAAEASGNLPVEITEATMGCWSCSERYSTCGVYQDRFASFTGTAQV